MLRLQSLGDVLLLVGLAEVGDLLLEVHDLAHVYALVHQVLAPHLFSLQVNRVDVVAVSRPYLSRDARHRGTKESPGSASSCC